MDMHRLKCFIAVSEELHFGRAAERVHLTQPAVTLQIRGLEEELGVRLFFRADTRVPGSASDKVARPMASELQKLLNQAITVATDPAHPR